LFIGRFTTNSILALDGLQDALAVIDVLLRLIIMY